MRSMRTLSLAFTMLGYLGLAGCATPGADGQVGTMGIPGPAGPVGPDGNPGATGGSVPDELDLPGVAYYPESIASAADGTLYVPSLTSTTIVKFAPGSVNAASFVTTATAGTNFNGVLVDEMDKSLLVCANNFSMLGTFAPVVIRYNLTDGTQKATYPFPAPGACNDMGFDGQHNLYVTDSFGKIYKLASGGSSLSQWSADALLAPSMNGGFGADGIAWDGGSNIYVNTFSDNRLLRIPINGAGAAGAATMITVTPALSSPDGMRSLDANTLVVIEGAGRLTKVTLSGNTATGTTLSNRLDAPTAVAKIGNNFWVTEGQLGHYFGQVNGPPNIPFLVRRVPLF